MLKMSSLTGTHTHGYICIIHCVNDDALLETLSNRCFTTCSENFVCRPAAAFLQKFSNQPGFVKAVSENGRILRKKLQI